MLHISPADRIKNYGKVVMSLLWNCFVTRNKVQDIIIASCRNHCIKSFHPLTNPYLIICHFTKRGISVHNYWLKISLNYRAFQSILDHFDRPLIRVFYFILFCFKFNQRKFELFSRFHHLIIEDYA